MTETEALMLRYIGICNRAIDGAARRFPFSAMIAALKDAKDLYVRVHVFDNVKADTVFLCLSQGCVAISASCRMYSSTWCVRRDTLQDIIDNDGYYSAHPEFLNWEWVLGVLDQPALSLQGKLEEQAPQA